MAQIGGEREGWIAKTLKLRQQIAGTTIKVLKWIAGIDGKCACCCWHQLCEAKSTFGAAGRRVIGAFHPDHRLK